MLKVSLKKLSITYLLGVPNSELFCANKMPHFTCNLSHYCESGIGEGLAVDVSLIPFSDIRKKKGFKVCRRRRPVRSGPVCTY